MTKHNPENERIKRRYFAYLKEAKRHSEPTVDAAAKALSRFEEYNRHKDFKKFRIEQASAFKRHLAEQNGRRSGERLSKATLHATLKQLRAFFLWLAGQPGFKARLQYSDADYFNLSGNDTRVAMAHRERKAPTLEQVKEVLRAMSLESDIECRNRALVAFTLLTGMRDAAIASLKLKHINLSDRLVYQDAKEVRTKFSKTFTTYFFPVGEEVFQIFAEWVRYLREEKLWGDDDPLFPATHVAPGSALQFEAAGLERAHWSTATPIRTIFRESFERVGLPYFNPHSFRNTLARLGLQRCQGAEEIKAFSQNLGHEQVLTTLMSYGTVADERQAEIIRGLTSGRKPSQPGAEEIAGAVARILRETGTKV